MTREEVIAYLKSYAQPPQMMKLFPSCEVIREAIIMLENQSCPQVLDDAAEKAGLEYAPIESGEALDLSGQFYETDDVNWPSRCGFIHGFKVGAKWMAGQGFSFEDEVEFNGNIPFVKDADFDILELRDSVKPGDKVIVQIRKI